MFWSISWLFAFWINMRMTTSSAPDSVLQTDLDLVEKTSAGRVVVWHWKFKICHQNLSSWRHISFRLNLKIHTGTTSLESSKWTSEALASRKNPFRDDEWRKTWAYRLVLRPFVTAHTKYKENNTNMTQTDARLNNHNGNMLAPTSAAQNTANERGLYIYIHIYIYPAFLP